MESSSRCTLYRSMRPPTAVGIPHSATEATTDWVTQSSGNLRTCRRSDMQGAELGGDYPGGYPGGYPGDFPGNLGPTLSRGCSADAPGILRDQARGFLPRFLPSSRPSFRQHFYPANPGERRWHPRTTIGLPIWSQGRGRRSGQCSGQSGHCRKVRLGNDLGRPISHSLAKD